MLTCGECQAANDPTRKFCSQCGAPLWENCLGCGERVGSSEKFCGVCGADFKKLVEEKLAEIAATVAEAAKLEAEHRFQDSARVLRSVKHADHHRLEQPLREVREKAQSLFDRSLEQQDALDAGLERIRGLIDGHEYKQAIAHLGKLPPALLEGDAEGLLREANSKQAEVDTLKKEIKQAVAEKKILELAPRIERLRGITTDHSKLDKLSQQIAKHVRERAKKLIAKRRYKEVLEMADCVPAVAVDDSLQSIVDEARELDWLHQDVKYSPLVDRTLDAVVKRLIEAGSETERMEEISTDIQRRLAKGPKSPQFPGISWARPPARTHLGLPIQWLGGCQRIRCQDASLEAELAKHPGGFFAAIGLALQGIGEADLKVNLANADKRGMLGKLSLGRKLVGSVGWGLDIGDSSLKFVKLAAQSNGPPIVAACGVLAHEHPLSQPGKDTQRPEVIKETLRRFLEANPIAKGEIVVQNLSANRVLARLMEVPDVPDKKLVGLIQHEAPHQIPIPLDDLAWGHQTLEVSDDGKKRVVLVAARLIDVRERIRVCEEVELPFQVLQSDAAAVHNYAAYDLRAEEEPERGQPLAFLDVGGETTSLIISSPTAVWFRTLRLAGGDLSTEIVKAFQLTHQQAETVKREPARAKSIRGLYEVLTPRFAQLNSEIQRSLDAYYKEVSADPIPQLYVVGEGVRMHGLLRHLIFGQ